MFLSAVPTQCVCARERSRTHLSRRENAKRKIKIEKDVCGSRAETKDVGRSDLTSIRKIGFLWIRIGDKWKSRFENVR